MRKCGDVDAPQAFTAADARLLSGPRACVTRLIALMLAAFLAILLLVVLIITNRLSCVALSDARTKDRRTVESD
ncbi:hypothetical protein DF156_14450 [Burkholderia ubonensis]|nr:hypothetical protein CJO66_14120 [Burkholderia ubonensis]RQP35400.1 hypothetical protein DF155_13250 [Burkholderia ubonensis]RQP41255.1 hypothetical protein DF156_14450 [Burkholderia ubonensis]RQP44984.1 hypothetical protein DF154_04580 [Burkholderia ubonensis]RQP60678.1 hypothetical protein DF151_14025 [Burkholderia ubonensis]